MLSYLLAGITLSPVVSQSLLDFCLFLIFALFAKKAIQSKAKAKITFRKPYLFEYGFIFYIIAIIAGFIVLDISSPDAWKRLYIFSWIINFYLMIWIVSRYQIAFNTLIKFFSWAFLVPNLYAIYCVFSGRDLINQQPIQSFRLTGLLNSATYHAHANAIVFIFFLTILYFSFKILSKFYKYFSVIAALLMFSGIYLTFTRGILISIIASCLLFLFFQHKKLFAFVLAAFLLMATLAYNISSNFRSRVTQTQNPKTLDIQRWKLINLHLKMISASPVVGIGYENPLSHTPKQTWEKYGFTYDYGVTTIESHAHNQLLNVLATTGLLGFIPFCIFYIWFFLTNLKLVRKFKLENRTEYYILSMACLMAQVEFFIANLTDIGFEYAKIRSLILLVWAIVFCLWKNRIKISASASA